MAKGPAHRRTIHHGRGLSQVEIHKERKELLLWSGRSAATKDHHRIRLTMNHLPLFPKGDAIFPLPSPTNLCLISRRCQCCWGMGHQTVHDLLQMDNLRNSWQKAQEMALIRM